MKHPHLLIILATLLLGLTQPTSAYWPVTVEEALADAGCDLTQRQFFIRHS